MRDLKIPFETNTTQLLHEDFRDYPDTNKAKSTVLSPNSVLAESPNTANVSNVAVNYSSVSNSDMYLKFVVQIELILTRLGRLLKNIKLQVTKWFILCPGGRSEEYTNVPRSPNIRMEKGWRFTLAHRPFWKTGIQNRYAQKYYKKENKIIDVDAIRKSGY